MMLDERIELAEAEKDLALWPIKDNLIYRRGVATAVVGRSVLGLMVILSMNLGLRGDKTRMVRTE